MRISTLPVPLAACILLSPLHAQYAERPDIAGSGSQAVDVSGRSVKNKRVRGIHSDAGSNMPGTTGWLLERDPYLAYQLGRNLNFREFRLRDGVLDSNVSGLAGPMPDGTTAKITRNNHVSCSSCHNLPYGNAGGGPNFSKDSGLGRNTPHYYGAGLIEMIALQTRTQVLEQADTNGDGWISVAEAQAAPAGNIHISPSVGAPAIDMGNCKLSAGSVGRPKLNNVLRVYYVDASGVPVPGATSVDGVTTHGYSFVNVVWGWGQGVGRSALNPTNRAFLWDPWNAHSGLQAHDPSTLEDPDGNGVSLPTVAGAEQFPVTHRAPDAGLSTSPSGISLDDPDGDGYLVEISEGDLDLAEWFLLNAPRPAFAGTQAQYDAGVQALESVGCTTCHVPDWDLQDNTGNYAGDRRFFDLEVTWDETESRLEGKVVKKFDMVGDRYVRRLEGFTVEGVFSDLAHHDMGPGFEEIDFGGNKNSTWRTPPLWGLASSGPWGHDGASLTLEHVIQRHGGAADASLAAWNSAAPSVREAALVLLNRLVLYDVETLPTDMDGDGVISPNFTVAGMDTLEERFNPEWLFRVPVQIQGPWTNSDGVSIHSFCAMNKEQAYGEDLLYRKDSDDDGWPDKWDRAPNHPGYRDGVH